MSTWYQENADGPLLEETIQIAWNYLQCTGEIDDQDETARFLTRKIALMMEQGQRNRLVLSNRAIAAFQRYRKTRTIEAV